MELHVKITEFYDNNNPWALIYYDTEIDISQQLKNCVIYLKSNSKEVEFLKNNLIILEFKSQN